MTFNGENQISEYIGKFYHHPQASSREYALVLLARLWRVYLAVVSTQAGRTIP